MSGFAILDKICVRKHKRIQLQNENRIKEQTDLPLDFVIDYDSFPKIKARYGTSWLPNALKLYANRSKGKNYSYKLYNDCLFETKPSWLMLERSELSDSPWTRVEAPSKDTCSLTLWDTSPLDSSLGTKTVTTYYKNKNKQLIMDRMSIEESLICENKDTESIGRLLFQQNMAILYQLKKNGSAPSTVQINNNCEMRSSSSNFCINMPISVGFCMKF